MEMTKFKKEKKKFKVQKNSNNRQAQEIKDKKMISNNKMMQRTKKRIILIIKTKIMNLKVKRETLISKIMNDIYKMMRFIEKYQINF